MDPSIPLPSTNPSYFLDFGLLNLLKMISICWDSYKAFILFLLRKKNWCSLRTSFSLVSLLCIDTNIVPLWCHSQRMKQGSADGLLAMLSELKVQMLQFCAVPLAQALRTVFQGPCGLDHHEWLGTSMCSLLSFYSFLLEVILILSPTIISLD